jgi:energy-converting hydrogenase Eha subunit G
MSDNIITLGNIFYGEYHPGFTGNVISTRGVSFAMTSMRGGNRQPIIPMVYER